MDEEIKGFKEQKVRENKASAQGCLPVLTELEQVLKGEGRAHASAGSLGNRQGRGLQTQREGEPPELSLNVQGELDSQVRWSKDQRGDESRQNKVTGGLGERDTGRQGRESMVGMPEDGELCEAMPRAKGHCVQTPERSGSRSPCVWASHTQSSSPMALVHVSKQKPLTCR